jgi:hypothetical protein
MLRCAKPDKSDRLHAGVRSKLYNSGRHILMVQNLTLLISSRYGISSAYGLSPRHAKSWGSLTDVGTLAQSL